MNTLPFSRSWWLWVRYFSQHRSSAWTEWSTFLESNCTTCEPTWSPLHTVKAEEWRKWKRTNTSGNQNGSKCCHTNSWFCTIVTADLWLKPKKHTMPMSTRNSDIIIYGVQAFVYFILWIWIYTLTDISFTILKILV